MAEQYKNPFTPIVGKAPLFMAGRGNIINDMQAALSSNGNDPAVITLLVGARGTGKTALLSHFADMAESDGWIAAKVSCSAGLLDDILIRTKRAAKHLIDEPQQRRVKSIGLAKIGSIEWEKSSEESSNWRSNMDDLLDLLEETDTGLLITVDEVNPESAEMETLISTFQHFVDEGRKTVLAMACLPYGANALLSGKSTSFLRRATHYELVALNDSEVEEAFQLTMNQGGKSFEQEALELAVKATGGFPFMLQLLGYRTWNLTVGRTRILAADVETAARNARKELEQKVYEATWFELTEADKNFLGAMLQDPLSTRQADIGKRLGRPSGHVSRYKKRMLQHGIIQERSKGVLEFCLPGFKEYFTEKRSEE